MKAHRLRSIGKGKRILWVHGLGESSLCFEDCLLHLSGHEHLLVDLPGYGPTERVEQSYSLSQAADLLADSLSETGPAAVVGHSMGGVIGTYLSQRRPEQVTCLINVDGNISIGDCGYSSPICRQSDTDFQEFGYESLLQDLRTQGETDQAHRGYALSFAMAQESVLYTHSQELVKLSKGEELAKLIVSLKVPHLYIAGSPNGAAPRSLDLLRQAKANHELIQPSGHWPFIDQPQAFATILKNFLGSHSPQLS